jgi:hypothetical protein
MKNKGWRVEGEEGGKGLGVKKIIGTGMLLVLGLAGCGSRDAALEEPPIITSATYQHTLYNGKAQPVEARAAKDDAPPFVITYFSSEEDLVNDRNGTVEVPSEVGSYYVRIERPSGNGYKAGRSIKVEYYIQKAFVPITAEERQEFVYDGKPKRPAAEAPVELDFSYYSFDERLPLEGPPFEPGRYRVMLSYSGDDRYMGASKELELVISR